MLNSQISNKLQSSISEIPTGCLSWFGSLNIGHWNLFEIWCLLFVIFCVDRSVGIYSRSDPVYLFQRLVVHIHPDHIPRGDYNKKGAGKLQGIAMRVKPQGGAGFSLSTRRRFWVRSKIALNRGCPAPTKKIGGFCV